ncbi:precorrin-3B synthase [Frankia sp. AiPs1]|uniref:nitrite reductase n=1 Tax=Frankia sp. AiPa1 TaxID=573492 RepID=UPI00202B70ED|nr:nitrite reductase [Frankia sp. AiPa1]MCL9762859.1 nitrite reductase [Frankia sp. AiPa1]
MSTSRRERAQDACPGVLRTHSAADGALARLRLPGGRLTAHAARVLAACARELADGHVELTSRGNVQLRGLADGGLARGGVADGGLAGGGAAELARRARAAGLLPSDTHERVRNIVASPMSGRVAHGRDVTPLVAALDRGLCADPALAALPGRVLFTVDDGTGDLGAIPADFALRALPGGRTLVRVAGEPWELRVPDADAVPVLLAAARAFVELIGAGGPAASAWRVAELPSGRERLLAAAAAAAVGVSVVAASAFSGGTRGGAESVSQGAGADVADPAPRGARPGVYVQRDGRRAVTVLVPLGRLRAGQLELAAELAGGDGLTVTPWRSVVLVDRMAADIPGIRARLAAAGLVVEPGAGWTGVTSCAGRPGCARSVTDVRRDATRLAAATRTPAEVSAAATRTPAEVSVGATGMPPEVSAGGSRAAQGGGPLAGSLAGSATGTRRPARASETSPGDERRLLPTHWSGCGRRCGQPSGSVVEVVAEPDGYRVHRTDGTQPPEGTLITWATGSGGELTPEDWSALVGAVTAARTTEAGGWKW